MLTSLNLKSVLLLSAMLLPTLCGGCAGLSKGEAPLARELPPAPALVQEVVAPAIPKHMDFKVAMASLYDHRVALQNANRRLKAMHLWYDAVRADYAHPASSE
jgi:hypothetical protein